MRNNNNKIRIKLHSVKPQNLERVNIGTGSNDRMLNLALSELQESIKFLNIIEKELKDSE